MTEHPIPSAGETQCDAILHRLQAARGDWVPLTELADVSNAYAVHSRIADLRKRGYRIPRPRLTRMVRDGRRICASEYCLPSDTQP